MERSGLQPPQLFTVSKLWDEEFGLCSRKKPVLKGVRRSPGRSRDAECEFPRRWPRADAAGDLQHWHDLAVPRNPGALPDEVVEHPNVDCCCGASRFQTSPCAAATAIVEPDKLAARFPPKSRPEETPLRKQFVISAISALIITYGLALAQHETPQQYDKSSAPRGLQSTTPDKAPVVTLPEANTPAPETTGQAPNFEDRWSAQGETPGRLPTATIPAADAPRTTDESRTPLDQGNGNWDPPPVTAPSTQR